MKYIIAILSFILSFSCLFAQNENSTKPDSLGADSVIKEKANSSHFNQDGYAQQLEQALAKNGELNRRSDELKEIFKATKNKEKKISAQSEKIKSDISRTQKDIDELKKNQKSSGYPELAKEFEQLCQSVNLNSAKLSQLREELSLITSRLGESDNEISELDKLKDEVSTTLISENQSYLTQPFSTLSIDQLLIVRKKCSPYTSDQKINAFVVRIDNTIQNKRVYDEINSVLNSKYQKTAISTALDKIRSLQNLSPEQRNEIGVMRKQLNAFGEGLAAFKEFINNLNRCREGAVYSVQFFQHDKKRIISDDLENRIRSKLLIVPYLKNKYDSFMNAFRKAPNNHSDIEAEILNQ